ncbi:aminopeptidase [Arenimonas maotaiensis]|uniref:Aminopeptidase n=1 Tax=Arenimonas maotaiensis TaxID=1446479 RepID=A0A917CQP1_9GAMM|nr:P1 family peptidase [Arenimonas maotaiensis]GGF96327.1 aminopeptidase [Arenimonas maotaiensis]
MKPCLTLLLALSLPLSAAERARDLGVPFDGAPGPLNAITDVAGVTVGHSTLHGRSGAGKAIHTGVTAVLPRGADTADTPVFGAWFAQNGNGEMTGTAWIEESGQVEGPILLTNTHSVGVVRDATIAWRVARGGADDTGYWWSLPVVAETWDGHLNDINGFHVTPEHAVQAIEGARSGPVAEGNVGGGSGMVCHEFKCGIGTASRRIRVDGADYTLGVLVQANYGLRDSLLVAGVPVGRHLRADRVYSESMETPADTGSIIIVVATDAPLLPHQLKRIAKRATMGLARMGSYAGNGSGDIFIAFSTANTGARQGGLRQAGFLANDALDPLFEATVQACEEAIVNSLVAAEDVMDGVDGRYAKAIEHAALVDLLKQYRRYRKPTKTP